METASLSSEFIKEESLDSQTTMESENSIERPKTISISKILPSILDIQENNKIRSNDTLQNGQLSSLGSIDRNIRTQKRPSSTIKVLPSLNLEHYTRSSSDISLTARSLSLTIGKQEK